MSAFDKQLFKLTKLFKIKTNVAFLPKRHMLDFVPAHESVTLDDIITVERFLKQNGKINVLTGAGVSTESGVPDYRSEKVGIFNRTNYKPIQYQDFLRKPEVQKRYWARAFVSNQYYSKIEPNCVHHILAEWERKNVINWLITQNVDGLHQKAGSSKVTELHGSLRLVKCVNFRSQTCDYSIPSFEFYKILEHLNPTFKSYHIKNAKNIRPDGDVEFNSSLIENFNVPKCPKCNSLLKPDVIFFGDNVPQARVNFVYNKLNETNALLIIGSSLRVFSSFKFLLFAVEKKKIILIVSIGTSGADNFKDIIFIRKRAGELFPCINLNFI